MLAVIGLEKLGLTPAAGDVIVTGAAGGVGSVAIALLSKLGYRVIASTGRRESEGAYLTSLGAAEIIDRAELSAPGGPVGKERWAGAVDSVGSHTLANVLARHRMAARSPPAAWPRPGSARLGRPLHPARRHPGGIESVHCPMPRRIEAWARLASDLDLGKLDAMTTDAGLADVPGLAEDILAGKVRGRVVVDVNR